MPKQWYSGTGMHRRSCSVKRMASAMKRALLTMLWCVSVAPLGLPVVPLVNWMLMASWRQPCAERVERGAVARSAAAASTSSKLSMPGVRSPMRITIASAGSARPCARRAAGQLGRQALQHLQVVEVLSCSAVTRARQPTLLSAYSSSASGRPG
jgi:hypothetical protein